MCIGLIKAVPYIVASSIFDKTCDNEWKGTMRWSTQRFLVLVILFI
jgi:hypothetical protein